MNSVVSASKWRNASCCVKVNPFRSLPKVFDILVTLVENGGQVVAKDDLMRRVWPNTFVEEGNLTQNISLLRKALGETPGGVQFIETVPRRGYRFVAETSETWGDEPQTGNGHQERVVPLEPAVDTPVVSVPNTTSQLARHQENSDVRNGRGRRGRSHYRRGVFDWLEQG